MTPDHSSHRDPSGLELMSSYLTRFVWYPTDHARVAHVLWCAHTHLIEHFDTTPRLVFTSADPGSGKSRALELTELFSRNAIHSVGGSSAWMVRTASDNPGTTMLIDEYDTVFAVGRTSANEQTRSHLNSGHRRGPKVGRMEKLPSGALRAVEFDPFGAVALAGLGSLPATVRDRSIIIRMKRPTAGERPAPWRARDHGAEAAEIHDLLADWADGVGHEIARSRPVLPPSIVDRRADVWEPLIAVADAAGGSWPAAARNAAVWFTEQATDQPASWGIQLLGDIRRVFTDRPGVTALWTSDLISHLRGIPESPWGEPIAGHDLTPRYLARILADYEIRSRDIRQGERVLKGYTRAAFTDAWARYLPDPEQQTAAPTDPSLGERAGARRGARRGRRPGHTNTTTAQEA